MKMTCHSDEKKKPNLRLIKNSNAIHECKITHSPMWMPFVVFMIFLVGFFMYAMFALLLRRMFLL